MRIKGVSLKERYLIILIVVLCCVLILSLFTLFVLSLSFQMRFKLDGEAISPLCWIPEGREYCAPQFIIAGGMKCGTTSLWAYLLNHPNVLPLQKTQIDPKKLRTVMAEKEVRFFTDSAYKQLSREYGVQEATNFYLDLFKPIPPTSNGNFPENYGKITGEASPMYITSSGIAERIKNTLPEVKIIIMLRNPIDRAYSDYWFRKNLKIKINEIGRFDVSGYTHGEIFQQCMEAELDIMKYCKLNEIKDDPSYELLDEYNKCYKKTANIILSANETSTTCKHGDLSSFCIPDSIRSNCQSNGLQIGMYVAQIYEWIDLFPRDQLLFIQSEEFYEDTVSVMQRVSRFLHIDSVDFNWKDVVSTTFNIINPSSAAGSKQELFTSKDGSKNGLQIGASNVTSEYPPLDPVIKDQLNDLLHPFNKALAKLIRDEKFAW